MWCYQPQIAEPAALCSLICPTVLAVSLALQYIGRATAQKAALPVPALEFVVVMHPVRVALKITAYALASSIRLGYFIFRRLKAIQCRLGRACVHELLGFEIGEYRRSAFDQGHGD